MNVVVDFRVLLPFILEYSVMGFLCAGVVPVLGTNISEALAGRSIAFEPSTCGADLAEASERLFCFVVSASF